MELQLGQDVKLTLEITQSLQENTSRIRATGLAIRNRTGTTVIVATHDREMVDSMHRRVIALEGGHVIRDQERGGYGNYGTN